MAAFSGGVFPYDGKALTKNKPIKELRPKGEMVYPLLQHRGTPARPVVQVGDYVLTGQMIAEAEGPVSAPVHASVSGTVRAIEQRRVADGSMCESVVIDNDGHYDEVRAPQVKPWQEMSVQEKLQAIHNAGVVGMSGTGMPAAVKFRPKEPERIEYVIANCIECEPYLTNDYRRMMEEPELIVSGLQVVLSLFPNAQGIIAVSDDNEDAAQKLRALVRQDRNIGVRVFRAAYPLGNERLLVHACTQRSISAKMLPSDAGCIVSNGDTLVAVYHAVAEGRPSLERIVTVTGDAVKDPCNYRVRIGTSYQELLEDAGGFVTEPALLLCGGTMTGVRVSDASFPTTKTASALVALTRAPLADTQPGDCIRCGRCAECCPLRLLPLYLADAAAREDTERFRRLHGEECMHCGGCTYICPAARQLSAEIVRMQEALSKGGAA